MNRSTIRLTAAVAGLAAGLVLTGCSAGQISQTATQESAVNGTSANLKSIALRNVHLQAVQTSDAIKPGTVVPLVMVVANSSLDTADKLTGITSEVGQVALAVDGALPAGGGLVFTAEPAKDDAKPVSDPAATAPTAAQVTLSQPITNGLTYNFTFNFEKAGQVTVAVPVAASNS